MSLNKEDLSQIKSAVHEEIEQAIDSFAGIVNKSFNTVEGQLNTLGQNLEKHGEMLQHIDKKSDHTNAGMDGIKADLEEIKGNIVYKYEFDDLESRVKYTELKLGIESGK